MRWKACLWALDADELMDQQWPLFRTRAYDMRRVASCAPAAASRLQAARLAASIPRVALDAPSGWPGGGCWRAASAGLVPSLGGLAPWRKASKPTNVPSTAQATAIHAGRERRILTGALPPPGLAELARGASPGT